MIHPRWLVVLFLPFVSAPWAEANYLRNLFSHRKVSRKIHGQVLDYTKNHGSDRRIWSNALQCKRDLYVYLPPGYDPCQQYPVIFWLHGVAQDELSFLNDVIPMLDKAIVCGKLPPSIIVAPDGSIKGHATYFSIGSFFVNSRAGNYGDYLMEDVWNFMHERFPIRPEREAHVMAGVSMGGGASFNQAFKYRERIGIVVGIAPPLNTRWIDCNGNYRGNFDPDCWGWREDYSRRFEVVARFYGIFTVRLGQVTRPLYGRRPDPAELSVENPIEILLRSDIKDGDYSMFVAWGGQDQFNIDAQVESFLYVAKNRGISIATAYNPEGKHDAPTALGFVPTILDWLAPQLAPYSPGWECTIRR